MRVMLVRPKPANILGFLGFLDSEPLDLEYLYTVLKEENIESLIYDGIFSNKNMSDVLSTYLPDLVVITGYITQEKLMVKYSQIVKKFDEKISVIFGGVNCELNYERLFNSSADYIFHSPCLKAFMSLIEYISQKKSVDCSTQIDTLKGFCYRKEKEWTVLPIVSIDDANEIPIPDRTYFYQNQKNYRYLDLNPVALVKSSFSCPYNCNFCYCRKLNAGKYVVRDIELVVKEIENIKCENIYIVDDSFLIYKERVLKFIELIKKKKIKKNFLIYSRADFISENEEIIQELGKIGVIYIMVGLEAVDNKNLDKFNKQLSNDHNIRCIEILNKYKIKLVALMIINIDATKEDFKNMYSWIKQMKLNNVTVSIFTPMPGTEIFNEYKNKIINKKIEHWDFLHLVLKPINLTKKRFEFEFLKLNIKLLFLAWKKGYYKEFLNVRYILKVFIKIFRSHWKE